VEAHDLLVVSFIYYNLDITVSLGATLVVAPLKRLELCVIDLNVLFAPLFLGILFSIAARTVFKRSEDCSGHIDVVHELGLSSKQSVREKLASLNGDWCKL